MKKIFSLTVLFSVLFLCISCDGFLVGKDLKDRIDNSIYIANAPTIKIHFSSDYGSINYMGADEYKKDVTYPLIFNAFTDYAFIEWKVYNKKLNKELIDFSSYIRIENVNENSTEFTVLSTEYSELEIRPFCVERPLVLNATPVYQTTGSYRDEPIVVWFDSQMSEASIYFNEEEIPENKEPVYSQREGYEDKIYAYGDMDEESGKIVNKEFKNIRIMNLISQQSIADCYNEPYFENPTKLVISPEKTNLPPMSAQIVVSVEKNMTSLKNGKEVSLYNSKKWNYLTNVNTDQDKPGFINTSEDKIKVEIKNYFGSITEISSKNNYNSLTESDLKSIYLKDNKIKLYMHFQDLLSGPAEAVIHYARMYDENYEITNDSPKFKTLTCMTSGTDGYFTSSMENKSTAEIDFEYNSDGTKIPDGIYKVWFGAKDKNGNEKLSYEGNDKYYYVLKDNTAPSVSNISYNYKNKKITWNSVTEPLYKVEVKYTNKSIANSSATVKNFSRDVRSSDYVIDFGNNSEPYYYFIETSIEDIFGNKRHVYSKDTIADLKVSGFAKEPFTSGDYEVIRGPNPSELSQLKVKFKAYSRTVELKENTIKLPTAAGGKVKVDCYKLYYVENGTEKFITNITDVGNQMVPGNNNTEYNTVFKIPYDKLKKGKYNTLKLTACKNVAGEVIESESVNLSFFEIDCEMVQGYAMHNGSDIWTGAEVVTNSSYTMNGKKVKWYSFANRNGNNNPEFYDFKDNGNVNYWDPATYYGKNIYYFWDRSSSNNQYVYEFEVNGITFYVGSSKASEPNVKLYFSQPF